MIDYVADYLENIRDRQTVSGVEPGYLRELVPDEAPRDPEQWDDVFRDIERVIMPGVSTLIATRTEDNFLLAHKPISVPNARI